MKTRLVATAMGTGLVMAGIGAWRYSHRTRSTIPTTYTPAMRWIARRTLVGRNRQRDRSSVGRFTRAEVDHLVDDAWRRYVGLVPHLPEQPTMGSRMNVRLAALTIGLFRAFLAAGIERTYAIELVSDVTWSVYKYWGLIGHMLGRVLPARVAKPMGNVADMARRVRPDGTVALSFPFNPPGYIAEHVPGAHGIAFDVIRCPVAAVFREHGAVDLCRASWCDLDYPLGEMQGLRLRRTKTLVEGADRCDFRWSTAEPTSLPGHGPNGSAVEAAR